MALPTLCHLFREMTVSDDEPAYIVRFKDSFTSDLKNSEQNLNLPWLNVAMTLDPWFKQLKCMPKENRDRVWMKIQNLEDSNQSQTAESSPPEPPRKRPRFFELSSNSEDELLMARAFKAKAVLQRYGLNQMLTSVMYVLSNHHHHQIFF